jgi:opacity protein-like surface antigen
MKRKIGFFTVTVVMLALATTLTAFAADPSSYFALKPGIFTPGGSGEVAGFESGPYVELSFGYYFNENFALEASLGGSSLEHPDTNAIMDVGPILSVNAKGIIPLDRAEIYGMFGIGVYDATIEGVAAYDISDTVMGADLGLGFIFKATDNFSIGLEWKTFKTEDVGDWKFELEGTTLSGVLRFGF